MKRDLNQAEPAVLNRAEMEALPPRASFALEIETAEADAGGKRMVRGVANTFGVMRSGRIIHPAAMQKWLDRNGNATLPFLAQHGYVDGFATLGRVSDLKVARGGLMFTAELASGLPLADQAWALITQKLLGNISIGWVARQARYVREDDADLDPHLAKEMKRAGVKEALAFLQIDLLEISLVDVGDDAGAKLAAAQRQIQVLSEQIREATHRLETGATGNTGGTPVPQAPQLTEERIVEIATKVFQTGFDRLFPAMQAALIESVSELLIDPQAEFAELLDEPETDEASSTGGCAAHGHTGEPAQGQASGLRSMTERLRKLQERRTG